MNNFCLLQNEIGIYNVDLDYRKYLNEFDNRVSLKERRKFLGIIVTINEIHYLVPLTSHPLRQNGKRRNNRTTVEIYDENDSLIAALLINNMIPVQPQNYQKLDFKQERDEDYLRNEYLYLKKKVVIDEILKKVENTYIRCEEQDSFMKNFCCNFMELEKCCVLYNRMLAFRKFELKENLIRI